MDWGDSCPGLLGTGGAGTQRSSVQGPAGGRDHYPQLAEAGEHPSLTPTQQMGHQQSRKDGQPPKSQGVQWPCSSLHQVLQALPQLFSSAHKVWFEAKLRTAENTMSPNKKSFLYKADERDKWKVIKTSLGQISNLPAMPRKLMVPSLLHRCRVRAAGQRPYTTPLGTLTQAPRPWLPGLWFTALPQHQNHQESF